MSGPIAGGRLFALPYRQPDFSRGPIELPVQTAMLDHLVDHPMWFASCLAPEEIRVNAAWMLANNEYMKWEIWKGGTFAGGIFLSRVVAPVDALFHFTLLGQAGVSLFSVRKLVWNFLGYAFEQFGLRRISMEIPEHAPKFISFARRKLAFRYEGELSLDRFQKLTPHLTSDNDSMRAAVALYGSRREGAHWNRATQAWSDVVLLRLTREEYQARASLGEEPKTTRETIAEVSDATKPQASAVRSSPSPSGSTGH